MIRTILSMFPPFSYQAHNLTVPSTWSDLAAFALEHNGTDGMIAVCMPWCKSYYGMIYQTMMATYVQVCCLIEKDSCNWHCTEFDCLPPTYLIQLKTHGPTRGFFFDTETLEQTIVNNSASEEVLRILKVGSVVIATGWCFWRHPMICVDRSWPSSWFSK